MAKKGYHKKPDRHAPPLILFLYSNNISLHRLAEILDIRYPTVLKWVCSPSEYLVLSHMILIAGLTQTPLKVIIGLCLAETKTVAGKWFEDRKPNLQGLIDSIENIPTPEEIARIKEI